MAYPTSREPALRRRLAGLLGTALIGLALSPVATALENVTLQLRWTHGFQFAGYYMAQEKGFYQQAGFEVTFREGGANIDPVTQVVSGQADFGVDGTNLVLTRAAGQPVAILAAIFQHSPFVLIVRKDSGILSPHGLIGHKVQLGSKSPEILAMFLQEGVALETLKIIASPTTRQDMLDPSIVAFAGYVSNEPFVLQHLNIDYRLLRPLDYGIDFYGDSLFTVESVIDRDPQRVDAFREASLEGWRYALTHPDETIALIQDRYNPEHRSAAHLHYEYATLKTLIWPEQIPIGQMNPHRWRRIAEIYAALGLLDSVPDIKGLIYDPEQRALQEQEARQRLLISVTAITLFGLAALGLWTWALRRLVRMRTRHLEATEQALKTSLTKYETLFHAFPLGITVSDANGQIVETNAQAERLLGVEKPTHEQRTINGREWMLLRPDGSVMPADEYASVRALKEHRQIADEETGVVKPSGETIWLNVTAMPLPLPGYGVIITYSDMTARKQAEEALRRALDEREVLLREVHHRVKNNLASIVGLIELQQQGVSDPSARDLLTQLGQRMRATALVHEMLYRAERLDQIDFHRYLQTLGYSLQDAFSPDGAIHLQTQAPGVWIELDQAMACGLLVNELVTNAFKYAFPQGQPRPGAERCEIQVTATMEGAEYTLTVADNGVGLPEGLDWRQVPSLGLVLARMLGQHQLRGRIELDRTAGTVFTLRFPAPPASSA